jgi:Formate hydrogenlyase subunit 6/NADH:ubiquinone oxidoreductase 23 kD subunit (chain I)
MIFYFSGTGNSKHIAEKIAAQTGERLVYMSEDTIAEQEIYKIEHEEKIGFIFPVYWYSVPTIVEKFITQFKVSGYQNQYVYAIATYGLAGGGTMKRLAQLLQRKNIFMNAEYGVKMVDNYVVGYELAKEDKQRKILAEAEMEIDKIISMIDKRKKVTYLKKGVIAFLTPATGYVYRRANHTKKFYVTKSCNGCKRCETNCPCNVIKMVNGKPQWEGNCTFCLNCINGCAQSAIQYGKHTEKRSRYQFKNV